MRGVKLGVALPSSLPHSRRTDMKDVDRKDGRRENGRGRRYYALSAMEVGGVARLASKNTSCTKHGFESTINARARPQDLEIQQQTGLIFIGSVAQLPQTSLSREITIR